jgi:hypothetical protein
LALAICAPAIANADVRLRWYVIASGGGESSGGGFRLDGTIGQPAVARLSGGNYTLQGGFWVEPRGAIPSATPTPTWTSTLTPTRTTTATATTTGQPPHAVYLPILMKRY